MSRDDELRLEFESKLEMNHKNICESLNNAYNTIGQKITEIDQKIKSIPNSPDKIKELRVDMDNLKLNQEDLKKQVEEVGVKFDKVMANVDDLKKIATSYFDRLEKDIRYLYEHPVLSETDSKAETSQQRTD